MREDQDFFAVEPQQKAGNWINNLSKKTGITRWEDGVQIVSVMLDIDKTEKQVHLLKKANMRIFEPYYQNVDQENCWWWKKIENSLKWTV